MNKITAVGILISKECDSITHGSSEYILVNEDVVNKRSKKPLDMKKMMEDGWDTKKLPRWDDAFKDGDGSPVLCVTSITKMHIVITGINGAGDYITSCGTMYDEAEVEESGKLIPATKEEALSLLSAQKNTQQIPSGKINRGKISKEKEEHKDANPNALKEQVHFDTDIEEDVAIIEKTETKNTEDSSATNEPVLDEKTDDMGKQEERQQTKKEEITVVKKEESGDIIDDYISLGLNKNDIDEFMEYAEDMHLDLTDIMLRGKGKATSTIVTFYKEKRKKDKEGNTEKHEEELEGEHESREQIESKLELIADYGLEPEDAYEFYKYKNFDKFSLHHFVSDATDEELQVAITGFYNNMEDE